jgi:hypothetical protein
MATVFDGSRHLGRALLDAALVKLHLGGVHTGNSRPLDEWCGLLAMAGFLATAAFGTSVWSRKARLHAIAVKKSAAIRRTVDWRKSLSGSSSGSATPVPARAQSVRQNPRSPANSSSLVSGQFKNL